MHPHLGNPPPPRPSRQLPPRHPPANPLQLPPQPPPPPPGVLTDSWGVGCIRTLGSRPRAQHLCHCLARLRGRDRKSVLGHCCSIPRNAQCPVVTNLVFLSKFVEFFLVYTENSGDGESALYTEFSLDLGQTHFVGFDFRKTVLHVHWDVFIYSDIGNTAFCPGQPVMVQRQLTHCAAHSTHQWLLNLHHSWTSAVGTLGCPWQPHAIYDTCMAIKPDQCSCFQTGWVAGGVKALHVHAPGAHDRTAPDHLLHHPPSTTCDTPNPGQDDHCAPHPRAHLGPIHHQLQHYLFVVIVLPVRGCNLLLGTSPSVLLLVLCLSTIKAKGSLRSYLWLGKLCSVAAGGPGHASVRALSLSVCMCAGMATCVHVGVSVLVPVCLCACISFVCLMQCDPGM